MRKGSIALTIARQAQPASTSACQEDGSCDAARCETMLSMVRFPARRFAWSALSANPEVGPLLGVDQVPPGHATLLGLLEQRHGMRIWAAELYVGWLEVA